MQQASLFGEAEETKEVPVGKPDAKETGDKKTYKAGDTIEFD